MGKALDCVGVGLRRDQRGACCGRVGGGSGGGRNAKKQHGGQCSVSHNLHTPLALGSKINVASAASLRPHLHKAEILKV